MPPKYYIYINKLFRLAVNKHMAILFIKHIVLKTVKSSR